MKPFRSERGRGNPKLLSLDGIEMRVDVRLVPFDEVRAAFLRENDIERGSNPWAHGAIEIAQRQFGCWANVTLSLSDILGTMLPHHTHGVDLVPPSGSSVAEAIEKLRSVPLSQACRKNIEELSARPASRAFLSMGPINHPDYSDYRGLIDRGHSGLTHLDGLHRLVAWGRDCKSGITAYVAGPLPR